MMKLFKNGLLIIKGLKIHDGSQFGPKIIHDTKSTYVPFFEVL